MTKIQELKRPMRFWLKQYPDQRLADLQAHAQSGRLDLYSCCCFIGSLTAPHALRGYMCSLERTHEAMAHYKVAKDLPGGGEAEKAFSKLHGFNQGWANRIVVALCKAEFRHRARLAKTAQATLQEELVHVQ